MRAVIQRVTCAKVKCEAQIVGEIEKGLVVLCRGSRPSWSDAAQPEIAKPLYEYFVASVRKLVSKVETGSFRKMMEVELVNDGPVTILLDSRKLF